ncbi:MAG: branched-chain amino acid ABC transporter permease [Clostridia bacterium]|nr:branched-chain amino acid ABC transporter permease [Clostridia bacterium]
MKKSVMKKLLSQDAVTLYIVAVLYLVVSVMMYSGNLSRQITNMTVSVSCYIVLAVSLNLVVGLLGELSLGHAGFMSVGLFSGCLVSISLNDVLPLAVRLPISMLVGGIAAAVVGLLVGLPALRLRGDYLAIVTLGCGEIIKNVITNLKITGGALGLNTRPIYSSPMELLPFVAILVVITVLFTMNLKRSRHGRAITAIRDNRIAAEATGINVTYYKLTVFILAAFFAGMAGTVYGHAFANVKAVSFDYNMSIEILVIVVLGGMGSVRGSVIAAILLQALPELLREFSDYRMLLYSILLIAIMLLNASPKFAELKGRWSVKNVIAFFRQKKAIKAAEKGE